MARIIDTVTKPAFVAGMASNYRTHWMRWFAEQLVERGWTILYDNTMENAQTTYGTSYTANIYLSDYKAYYENTFTTELAQMRLAQPGGRLEWLLTYNNSHLFYSWLIPGGIGDHTSLHPHSGNSQPHNPPRTLQNFYTDENIFNREVLTNGQSFMLQLSQTTNSARGFCLTWNIPQKLTEEELPRVSVVRVSNNPSGTTNGYPDIDFILWYAFGDRFLYGYAMSDSLVGYNTLEQAISPIRMSVAPLNQGIVNIESALIPAIWSNTGAYRFENLYWMRSTYPASVVQGVVQLKGISYRVLYSGSDSMLVYQI